MNPTSFDVLEYQRQMKLSHPLKRFILYHQKRHPAEMGEAEISQFLNHLAVKENVAASTQNQALCAILFLYKQVLKIEIENIEDINWAKKSKKIPEFFTHQEVQHVIANLKGVFWLMGVIMYGTGLRLIECLRLRVKDVDFESGKITVRSGKGEKDRITMLPELVVPALQKHLNDVKKQHEKYMNTTIIYTHALKKGVLGVRRPMDMLATFNSANSGNALEELPPPLLNRFKELVKKRYKGDLGAAISAFLDLHGNLSL